MEPEAIKNITDWYKVWFDSPYYHLLYQNRNYEEAEVFINNLLKKILSNNLILKKRYLTIFNMKI